MILTLSLFSLVHLQSCTSKQLPDFVYKEKKMKGLSFVAPSKRTDSTSLLDVKRVNAEWISVMPYGYVKSDSGHFFYSGNVKNDWQWWGERVDGAAKTISMAHESGIKVMLKPHLWIGWGEFTGHMDLKTEQSWSTFEKGYGEYILTFAKLADSLDVEVYCIATEMEKHVELRPEFWHQLIRDIRIVYSGKLTYAENWDSYGRVPFWDEMDYIGVDAYFPLSEKFNPSASELTKGWKSHLEALNTFATKHQKPVLFTEIGYRSCDYTAQKPWETNMDLPSNEEAQRVAYEAFFKAVWQEPWFAGAFIWKWFPNYKSKNARDKFTPQYKLAEQELKAHYQNL